MKYTKSIDGEMRVTVRAELRMTQDELAEMRAIAKAQEITLKRFFVRCFQDGVLSARDIARDDDDPTNANTGENC